MEALAVLSLACNVIQLIEVSIKVTKSLKDIADENAPDAQIQSNAVAARQLGHEVTQAVTAHQASGSPGNTALLRRAGEMVTVSDDLGKLLSRFTAAKKNKLRDTFAYIKRQRDIKSTEKRLAEIQQAFQTTLLIDIRGTVISQWSALKEDIEVASTDIKTLAAELHKGNTNVLSLVQKLEEAWQLRFTAAEDQSREQARAQKADIKQVQVAVDHRTARHEQMHQNDKEDAKIEKFVSSLWFTSMNSRRNMQSLEAAKGTFDWVFGRGKKENDESKGDKLAGADDNDDNDDDDYDHDNHLAGGTSELHLESPGCDKLRLWLLDNTERMFWVSGHAGSGKSTLMRYMIGAADDVVKFLVAHELPALVLAAFIWSSGDEMQRSVQGVLCSLLYQVLSIQRSMAWRILNDNVRFSQKISPSDWSETELRNLLDSILRLADRQICIFVDGLDEISQNDGSSRRLLDWIRSLHDHRNVKLCVSSRPEPIFERSLQHHPHFRLHDLTWGDIYRFVKQELEKPLSTMPPSFDWRESTHWFVKEIVSRAQGVWLWVRLVVRSLQDGISNFDTWDHLWRRLQDIPDTLEALYTSMLERRGASSGVYHESAGTFFALVLSDEIFKVGRASLNMGSLLAITLYLHSDLREQCLLEKSYRSKSSLERLTAINGNVLQRLRTICEQMRAQCGGLLRIPTEDLNEVDKNDDLLHDRVEFIHRTAHDFIIDQGYKLWQHAIPDLARGLEAQLAHILITDRFTIQPVNNHFPRFGDDVDILLLKWCLAPRINKDEQRLLLQRHRDLILPRAHGMDIAERVICLSNDFDAVQMDLEWLAAWTPLHMTKAEHLNRLLLVAAACSNQRACVFLLDHGAELEWQDNSLARGLDWPTALDLCLILVWRGIESRWMKLRQDFMERLSHYVPKTDREITILVDRGLEGCRAENGSRPRMPYYSFNRSTPGIWRPDVFFQTSLQRHALLPVLRMRTSVLHRIAKPDVGLLLSDDKSTEVQSGRHLELASQDFIARVGGAIHRYAFPATLSPNGSKTDEIWMAWGIYFVVTH
ncbi:ankyrin repeat domain-containing protein 50 [Microdochium nivale]|nr:ankyrin repeat domain-containing protein 50 [Microdochium nivale]